jgi:Ca2+-binding EF-hand superfamily protein
MISVETERRTKNVLVALAGGERGLENSRDRLCRIPDFSPLSAFERVDRNGSGGVNAGELQDFLRDNGIHHVTLTELDHLVAYFDSNGNKTLDNQEFFAMFLPCEDNFLRDTALARPSVRVLRFDRLPSDIEFQMAKVLEQEIDLQRSLEVLKADLEMVPEYNANSVFNFIDTNKSGTVSTDEVSLFLKRAGYYATDLESLAIIRRLDSDGNSMISYSEFAEFMRRLIPAPRPVAVPVSSYVPVSAYEPYVPRYTSPYYYSRYYPYRSLYDPLPAYRSYYDPLYSYVPSYLRSSYAPYVRTSVSPAVYSSPVKTTKIGDTTIIESPSGTTAYTSSSPVRTVVSPYYDRSYISPYTGRVISY